jgi:hypothetical protein
MTRAPGRFPGFGNDPQTQDLAEYGVMLVVILLLVICTAMLIGGKKGDRAVSHLPRSLSK